MSAPNLLLHARSIADRHFIWWRPLLEIVNQTAAPSVNKIPNKKPYFQRMSDLRKWHEALKRGVGSTQQRGLDLEEIINSICAMTFTIGLPSYRRGWDQCDGYFECNGNEYIIEAKWWKNPVGKSAVTQLRDNMHVAGVCGVLISQNGFKKTAIENAKRNINLKRMIFIDGDELELVLSGNVTFDELVRRKHTILCSKNEVYEKISS